MLIGRFSRADDGFVGRLQTLTIDVSLRIVPLRPGDNPKAPAWRIYRDDIDDRVEVGSGWTHALRQGGTMIAVHLDCPMLGHPLRATLLPDAAASDHYVLIWSRDRSQSSPE